MTMRRRAALLSMLALGAPASAFASAEEGGIATLGGEGSASKTRLDLPAGRSRFRVVPPRNAFVTVAVFGPPRALLGLEMIGGGIAGRLKRNGSVDEDGLLPRTLSFSTDGAVEPFDIAVDLTDPANVQLVWARIDDDKEPTRKGLKDGSEVPRALIGFPVPATPRDGYAIAPSGRYVFARIDVVKSLLVSLDKARKRFNGDPIFLSDASQWNGKRPKTDIGNIRHISHEGGCDIDIALPASDTLPSSIRDHCRGVRLETDRFGCAPGTAKGVNFDRLTYFLGTLADEAPGRIVKIYLDDVYRREVIRVAPTLRDRGLMKEAGLVALGEDGVLVASSWHTDHVHVRFAGEKARSPFG